MRSVRDDQGRRYLVLKESDGSILVRDTETGEERYLSSAELEPVDTPPLETAATGIPTSVRRVVRTAHDERTLGLLVETVDRGEMSVRDLLAETTLCESDLHGTLAELVAAGLLVETTVGGERGYEPTDVTEAAIEHLRE